MLNCRYLVSTAVLVVFVGASAFGQAPPTKLELNLPRYEVTEHESLHFVRIPGGQMLIEEEGRPQVPYFVEFLDYPRGYRVRNVVLKERSGAEETTGLRLTAVIMDMNSTKPVVMKEGLYPDRKHTWRVVEMPDGASRLAVAVYPFDYDPKTTDVTYYRNYDFDIEYVQSSIVLVDLTTDKHSYTPSEPVRVHLTIVNDGEPRDVRARASILRGSTGELVAELPAQALAAKADTSSTSLALPTRGIPNGDYYADVAISDPEGNVLDKEQVGFRVGIPGGEMTRFEVAPQHFRVGDAVKLSLGFKNTGSTALSGQSIFEIRVKDSVVAWLTRDFEGLPPGKSRQFADSWKTGGAKENVLYNVVGYVSYEATATPAEQVVISTNAMPSAEFTVVPDTVIAGQEVRFDASGSKDSDGAVVGHRWEFGDGGEAEGVAASHVYPEPGEFLVTLTVTDNEGGSGTATKDVVVGE